MNIIKIEDLTFRDYYVTISLLVSDNTPTYVVLGSSLTEGETDFEQTWPVTSKNLEEVKYEAKRYISKLKSGGKHETV